MKKNIIIFFSFHLFFGYADGNSNLYLKGASPLITNELNKIDDLIEVSKQNLLVLTQLKVSVEKYKVLQINYMECSENNEILYQMIKEAHAILEAIKKSQLTPLFDPAFISELTVVSKPISKLGIPKP